MTIGTGTFVPNGLFSLPRSYLYRFCVATYLGNTCAGTGPTYIISAVPPDPTFAVIEIDPAFYAWSSDTWTLPRIVTEFYYEVPPSIVRHPVDFTLSYGLDPVHHEPALLFEWFLTTPTFFLSKLPAQPPGYWAPRPLP